MINKRIQTQPLYSVSQLLRDLWFFIRPYRGKFWLGTVLRISSDLAWLYPAWALGQITTFFSQYHFGQPLGRFWLLVAGYGGAALYRFTMLEVAKYNGNQVAERIGLDARLKTLRHLFFLDLSWHETMNSGVKLKRISRGGEGLNRIVKIYYTNILESALNIVAVIVILRGLGWWFASAFSFFIVTYYWFSYLQTKRAKQQSILVSQKEEELEGIAFESINNIITIKTMGMARAVVTFLSQSMDRLMREIRTRIKYVRTREATLNLYMAFARVCGYLFVGYGIAQGHYEVGLLIMFDGYFQLVWKATAELATVTNEIIIDMVGIGRMMELVEVKPTIETGTGIAQKRVWKKIEVKDLSFAYRDRDVLKDVNLTIMRGEKIGIVGPSGAGKTTLFKILLKLYAHYRGNVSIDQTSLKDIERDSFIARVAVVMQDTELFDLSLKDNITIVMGEGSGDKKRLDRALAIAHLDELLPRLPQGVDTLIGEKGIRLSGGEKQRLGIARAVYKNPEILFMDEATSHLDANSEQKIQGSLHEFFKEDLTAVVIAHRLSTIKEMDRIIVMDKGRIVEEGTFDVLVKKKGLFYKLWEKQKL